MFELFNEKREVATPYKPQRAKTSGVAKRKKEFKKLMRKEVAKEIVASIGGFPKDGYSVDVLTNGQSNAGGFYEIFRDEVGVIDELYLSTWIMNKDYVNILFSDIEKGRLKSLYLVISDRMSRLNSGRSAFNVLKSKCLSYDNANLRVANIHAKTYTMKGGGSS